MAHNAQISDKD